MQLDHFSPPKQDEEQQLLADATLLAPAHRVFPDLCAGYV
jgi:hypothetical protein